MDSDAGLGWEGLCQPFSAWSLLSGWLLLGPSPQIKELDEECLLLTPSPAGHLPNSCPEMTSLLLLWAGLAVSIPCLV